MPQMLISKTINVNKLTKKQHKEINLLKKKHFVNFFVKFMSAIKEHI